MRRRDFITGIAGSAVAWPFSAHAQQRAMPVIGFIGASSPNLIANHLRAFHQGLSETDHIEGRNVAIEYRWAEGHNDRLPALAADLVRRQVQVIATNGPPALPTKAATTTIPIVFTVADDPVKLGLVESLNRPGGNLTGISNLNAALASKRLELLHELVPAVQAIAVLINPSNTNAESLTIEHKSAGDALGLQLHVLHAGNDSNLDAVFAMLSQVKAGALAIGTDAFFNSRVERIAALTLRHAVPTIYQNREFAAAGGLM